MNFTKFLRTLFLYNTSGGFCYNTDYEVVFSRKRSETHHLLLIINNVSVKAVNNTKPDHEIVFSRKRSETRHLLLIINNVSVKAVPFHKDIGLKTQNLILINILLLCCPRLIK